MQLDQWADKIFHLAMMLIMLNLGIIHFYFVTLYVAREIVITLLRYNDIARSTSNFLGKLKTFLTYSLIIVLLGSKVFLLTFEPIYNVFLYGVEAAGPCYFLFVAIPVHGRLKRTGMRLFLGTTLYTSLIYKKAPGTVSSLAVWLLFYIFNPVPFAYEVGILVVAIICHVFCFSFFEKKYGNDDPALYTLDETIAIILLHMVLVKYWVAVFFIFRFFDIVKPLGIKKIEKTRLMPSIVRNLADDLIAALYTAIVIKAYDWFF